ncbi:MAG TPA: CHAT domain-containing protein [Acidobacteriota bacterium]|nr:CHAT domain-containing protein [Acidobacteriota bacterium]
MLLKYLKIWCSILSIYGVVWITAVSALAATPPLTVVQSDILAKPPTALKPGQDQSNTIQKKEIQVYQWEAQAGECIELTVVEETIEVVLTVLDPAGKTILTHNIPDRESCTFRFLWLAETAGTYQLQVTPKINFYPRGTYRLTGVSMRKATSQDQKWFRAIQLMNEGDRWRPQRDLNLVKTAIPALKEAKRLFYELGDTFFEASVTNLLAIAVQYLDGLPAAIPIYEETLALRIEAGDVTGARQTALNMAAVYFRLGDKEKCFACCLKARKDFAASTDRYLQLLVYTYEMAYRTGFENYTDLDELAAKGIQVARELGFTANIVSLTVNYGIHLRNRGELSHSMQVFHEGLKLAQEFNVPEFEGTANEQLAEIYFALGDLDQSLHFRLKAVDCFTQAKSAVNVLNNQVGMAIIALRKGEYQKALDQFHQLLASARQLKSKINEGNILYNLSLLAVETGDYEKAMDYNDQSLLAFDGNPNPIYQIQAINHKINLMVGYYKDRKALDLSEKVIAQVQTFPDKRFECYLRTNYATALSYFGDYEKALAQYETILNLWQRVGDRYGEGHTLLRMGSVAYSLKQPDRARENFLKALPICQATFSHDNVASCYLGLAVLERDAEHYSAALENSLKAIEINESLRANFQDQQARSNLLSKKLEYYEFHIDLLMRMHQQDPSKGYNRQAFEFSDRTRARSLAELLTEARVDIRQGVNRELLDRERNLREQFHARALELQQVTRQNTPKDQIETIEKNLRSISEQYQQVQTEIRRQSPRYAQLTQPQGVTVDSLQKNILDADSALVEFSLGKEKSYVWVLTTTGIESKSLPNQAEIEPLARTVYELLTTRQAKLTGTSLERLEQIAQADTEYWTAAARLSEVLFQGLKLPATKKRLIIVPDGVLNYVPFAALPRWIKSERLPAKATSLPVPLIQDFEIINLPSASVIGLLRTDFGERHQPSKHIAIFADPVFEPTDVRVTPVKPEPVPAVAPVNLEQPVNRRIDLSMLKRLVFSRQEALGITSLVAPDQLSLALDFKANLPSVQSPALADYQIIHFATHGIVNTTVPEISGLVFSLVTPSGESQNGYLRLTDVYNLQLQSDLVVLSACQTGLGKEIKGEGIIGLTRGFMYAGAPRVVSSLRMVDDSATAELMKRFYAAILGPKRLSPAAALRQAQLELAGKGTRRFPYYWAAFQLQGEWKPMPAHR